MKWEVISADCLEAMKDIPDGSVDCVVTDPPYGVNKAEWDAVFPVDWIPLAERIAPRMLLMTGNSALIEAGSRLANYRDCIAMYAVNGMTRSKIAFGNWFPVLASGDWKWEARPNLLKFTVDTVQDVGGHESPKPLKAMLELIGRYTKPEWTILDPFCGSGTTGVACAMLGRNFIGIELDPHYAEVARARINRACGVHADIPRRIRVEKELPLFSAA